MSFFCFCRIFVALLFVAFFEVLVFILLAAFLTKIKLVSLKTVLIDAGFEVEEVEQCLQEMDKNKNGEISKEEFAHWWFFNHHHERVLSIRDKVKQHYRGGEGKGDDRAD